MANEELKETEDIDNVEMERDQLLFELISDTYNSEKIRNINLDNKASKLIVFVGIIISLLSSFGSLLLKDIPRNDELYFVYLIIFILSLLVLISSIICGLRAYKIRKFKFVPVPDTMIKWGKENKNKIDILRIISKERSDAVKKNKVTLSNKTKHIKRGYYLLLIGIILSLIFINFFLATYDPTQVLNKTI